MMLGLLQNHQHPNRCRLPNFLAQTQSSCWLTAEHGHQELRLAVPHRPMTAPDGYARVAAVAECGVDGLADADHQARGTPARRPRMTAVEHSSSGRSG
jgi:hypothetical protein